MAKPGGFLEFGRQDVPHRPVDQRVKDYFEVDVPLDKELLHQQAARCMDCGIPFCHGTGCPLKNRIPEWNDLVYRGKWKEACENLHSTNNFPEITGRICPALCEAACSLAINDKPVLIRHVELQIVERGWAEGWIVPLPPRHKTGQRVAVIGSGPAGLAAAQQLARAGHTVTVYEKDSRIGGLLRYGIPDFKLDKRVLDRRIEQMQAEGVAFQPNVKVGEDISIRYLRQNFDAVVLTMGAGHPRDLAVPGRELDNVHFALDYLGQQNRVNAGDKIAEPSIDAAGKVVAVIGGGDTGSDCVGTARRQGAKDIHQFEVLPEPPKDENPQTPWPLYPRILRTSTSHEEGCTRHWSVATQKLVGAGKAVSELHGCQVEWVQGAKGFEMRPMAGTEFTMKVDLVLLAMGFVHVVHPGLVQGLGLKTDGRGNLVIDGSYMTSERGIFAAGDAEKGATLVVHGINAGRLAAAAIDDWLKKQKK